MCGITGIAEYRPLIPNKQDLLKLSCEKIKHRGPDAQNTFCEKNIGLGSTRLAIRDVDNGHQPITYKHYVMVFNGEIYNDKPLKKKLQECGYQIKSSCDTEIFLYLFVEFGISYLDKIDGMFAFAIWDKKEEKLYLGIDRWGEKPLYYSLQKGALAFASEITALKVWPHMNWEPSNRQLLFFLKHSYLCGKNTGWKKIKKLEPGTILTYQKNAIEITTYFQPKIVKESLPIEELPFRIEESVKNCLISDRPVGTFLSGGLDSAIISYFAVKHRPDLKTFSLDWREKDYSEQTEIIESAHLLGLENYRIVCTPEFFQNHFDFLVEIAGEPFADESLFPCHCLALFAKQHVDVVLTGDGADELFHGYERYYSYEGPLESYADLFSATPDALLSQIVGEYTPVPLLPKNNNLREKSLHDMKTYLPHDILTKIDRATMAASLESRAPFLTENVFSCALSLPQEMLYDSTYLGKKALKISMCHLLPNEILRRKKNGFGMPLAEWFRTSLFRWSQERLFEGSLSQQDWIKLSGIKNLFKAHVEKKINASRPLLNLLVLESWLTKSNFIS